MTRKRLSPLPKTASFVIPIPILESAERALAEFVKGVWTAFPDFHLELLNCGEIEPELVAIHLVIAGDYIRPKNGGSAYGTKRLNQRSFHHSA